jgi:nucleotide-binding universal stress UspA family protein
MFKNILMPTDGSDLAAKSIEQAVHFAKEIGAKITAVTVAEPFHAISVKPSQLEYTPIEYKKHAETHAAKVLRTVSAAAKSAGVICETLHVEHEQVYQAIIGAAEARRCDLIVMASHGRLGGCPRQRDGQSAHALEDPRSRVSLTVFSGARSVLRYRRRLHRGALTVRV